MAGNQWSRKSGRSMAPGRQPAQAPRAKARASKGCDQTGRQDAPSSSGRYDKPKCVVARGCRRQRLVKHDLGELRRARNLHPHIDVVVVAFDRLDSRPKHDAVGLWIAGGDTVRKAVLAGNDRAGLGRSNRRTGDGRKRTCKSGQRLQDGTAGKQGHDTRT